MSRIQRRNWKPELLADTLQGIRLRETAPRTRSASLLFQGIVERSACDEDVDGLRQGILLEPTAHLDAVEVRHGYIEDDEMRLERSDLHESIDAVLHGLDQQDLIERLEYPADDPKLLRIIVDDEQTLPAHTLELGRDRHLVFVEEFDQVSDPDATVPTRRTKGTDFSFLYPLVHR